MQVSILWAGRRARKYGELWQEEHLVPGWVYTRCHLCWWRCTYVGGRYDPQLVKRSSEWVSHLYSFCRPASGHTMRGVSERGPVINQRSWTASSNPELGEYKGSVGSCPQVLHVAFSCVLRVYPSIHPRGIMGGPGGKVGCFSNPISNIRILKRWKNVSKHKRNKTNVHGENWW